MAYRQWEIELELISEDQKAALAYWQSLPKCGPLSIPMTSSLELAKLPSAALPTTHLVDVLDGGREFRYRFWGSGFRDYLGYDGTGTSTADLKPAEIAEPVRDAYRSVVNDPRPYAMLSEFERGSPSSRLGFQRFIRFPLGGKDGSVAQVLSVVEFLMDNRTARKLVSEMNGTFDI